jgi:hypothetical protein
MGLCAGSALLPHLFFFFLSDAQHRMRFASLCSFLYFTSLSLIIFKKNPFLSLNSRPLFFKSFFFLFFIIICFECLRRRALDRAKDFRKSVTYGPLPSSSTDTFCPILSCPVLCDPTQRPIDTTNILKKKKKFYSFFFFLPPIDATSFSSSWKKDDQQSTARSVYRGT